MKKKITFVYGKLGGYWGYGNCEDCRYWGDSYDSGRSRRCHNSSSDSYDMYTYDSQGCGEFSK